MINNIIITGRLTASPELKSTTTGKKVTKFTVAVERRFSREQTDFIDVVAWEKAAEFVCKYFQKGNAIAVQGNLQTRNWEDSNGNKRKSVEVVAEQISFCGSKNTEPATPNAEYTDIPDTVDDEDLPF